MQAMVVAALIVSIVAVLVAAVAAWYTRRQALAADRAADTADTALNLARAADRRAAEAEDRARIVWELEHVGGAQYVLHNHGTEKAYGVHVDLGDFRIEGHVDFAEFPSGHAEWYLLGRGLNSTQTSITVTWHERSDLSDTPKQNAMLVLFTA